MAALAASLLVSAGVSALPVVVGAAAVPPPATYDSHGVLDPVVWFDEPAADWQDQGLPIGNGPMGAMIFGGVGSERVQFNHDTLWTGRPGSNEQGRPYNFGNWYGPRPGALREVREEIAKTGQADPHASIQKVGLYEYGYGSYQNFGDISLDQMEVPAEDEVTGYRRSLNLRAALPALRESDSASIVNTCSVAATAGLPRRALYSATKGAVQSLTLAMAADHVREGVRVNCVNPGTVDTPWVGRLLDAADDPQAERDALAARQPSGRLVSAEEAAHAIVYLASPLSRSTTGTALAVDGGMQGLRLRPAG